MAHGSRRARIVFSDSAAKQLENITSEAEIHALDRALVVISVDPDAGEPLPGDSTGPRLRQYVDDVERVRLQADDLYELVSERQGRSLIITSNRAPSDWYPLFPNPVVAESLLDRLINASHQIIMNGPSYRPNKRPRNPGDKNGTAPS